MDSQYTYTFNGWSPSVATVTGDQTYVAKYSSTTQKYTIIWKNYNGIILETDNNVPYGSTPTYNGSTPTKAMDSQYTYTFNGWSPSVATVTGDQTYVAQFAKNDFLIYTLCNYGTSYSVKLGSSVLPTNLVVVIPDVYLGKPITLIENNAFKNCTNLSTITLGNSITSIGDSAFYGCTNLSTITLGNSITSIGSSAFYKCLKLTNITIPNSVTSIGAYAFSYCSSLTSITIPNSVTSIGDYAFSGCSSLTSIVIPNSVTFIGAYAFSGCSSLTSIVIPDSVTFIDAYAFSGCSSLTIYAEAIRKPSGWNSYWNYDNCPVVWGYTG